MRGGESQGAHVLVHPSRMEGGAHVVIEAVLSGTPVLASRIDGNVGLLGKDYAGYFPVGDAGGLAALLQLVRDEPSLLTSLPEQSAERRAQSAPRFSIQGAGRLLARRCSRAFGWH